MSTELPTVNEGIVKAGPGIEAPPVDPQLYVEKVKAMLAYVLLAGFFGTIMMWTFHVPKIADGTVQLILGFFIASLGGMTQHYFQSRQKPT